MATGDAVTLLAAEYQALRAEIDRRSQAQQTVTNIALTLTGALVAYAIANEAIVMLLVQPIVVSALGLLYADHGSAIRRVSRYIDRRVAPAAIRLTGEPVLQWEGVVQNPRTRAWRPFWLIPQVLVFIGSSVAVLGVALYARVYDTVTRSSALFRVPLPLVALLWVVGVLMTALASLGFFASFRLRALETFEAALDAAEESGQAN